MLLFFLMLCILVNASNSDHFLEGLPFITVFLRQHRESLLKILLQDTEYVLKKK